MAETILVTGGTGFTGEYTVPLIARSGFKVRCLARRRSDADLLTALGAEPVYGDLDDPGSLGPAFQGVSGLISLVGLHTGYAAPLVDSAVAHGVQRAVFVSSTSVFTRPDTPTKSFLTAAEKHIRDSGLRYTIIRPTMIYGNNRDRNISRLVRYLTRWPVLFIPGPGTFLVQPIFVEDVAGAVVKAYQTSRTAGKSYNIAGRDPLAFNDLVDTILSVLGKKCLKVHLPASPLIAGCKWAEARGLRFFLRSDQFERLNEDKAFGYEEAAKDFQFSPVPFETGIRRAIENTKAV